MPLTYIETRNVRILSHISLQPDSRMNLAIGPNASGKTSPPETIHILGIGRPLRTNRIEYALRDDAEPLVVFGHSDSGNGRGTTLGVQRDRQGRQIKVNGDTYTQTAVLAQALPLQFIAADIYIFFQQHTRFRRVMLDWGLFHVEPMFFPLWSRYRRLLK